MVVGGGWGRRGGQRWPAEQWLILQTRRSLDLYLLTEQFVTSLRIFLCFLNVYAVSPMLCQNASRYCMLQCRHHQHASAVSLIEIGE